METHQKCRSGAYTFDCHLYAKKIDLNSIALANLHDKVHSFN